jgi:DNA-directed RNA polymerase subunit RPC12/RpoP
MNREYIISRAIKKEYPNLKFVIEVNGLGNTTFNFNTFTMTLLDEMKWKDIKRYINKYSKERETHECNICNEINYALIPCNKCSNDICMRCTAYIIEKNQGIIKCPYCSIETGFKQPPFNVLHIRDNLLMKNFEINKKMNNLITTF